MDKRVDAEMSVPAGKGSARNASAVLWDSER